MRWGAFAAALLGVCIIQTTALSLVGDAVGRYLDLFMVLALLCGLCASPREAPIAAWIVGLVQDLVSIDPFGAHAVGLALGAIAVVRLREWAFADVIWIQACIAAVGGLAAGVAVELFRAISLTLWHSGSASPSAAPGFPWAVAVVSAVAVVLVVRLPGWITGRGGPRPSRRDW